MAEGRGPKKKRRRSKKKSVFSLKKLWTRRRARIAKVVAIVLVIFAAGVVAGGYYFQGSHVAEISSVSVYGDAAAPIAHKKAEPLPRHAKAHIDLKGKLPVVSVKKAPPEPTAAPVKPVPSRARSKPQASPDKMLASLPPQPDRRFSSPAQVAIIIDDIGQSMRAVEQLLAIGLPIALAILPHQPHSRQAALLAGEKGHVVMLHLPMEPKSKGNNPGQGALYSTHDAAQLQQLVISDIEWIPGAVGVNNHMGSLLTERVESMAPVMKEIRARGLFFVDSRTSADSVAYKTARRMGIPAAKRDVFLDNDRDVRKIIKALELLMAKALKNGSAVGIGHPYPETIRALELFAPRMGAMGVKATPVTRLLRGSQKMGIHAKKPHTACMGPAC
ncbi:MAG: divergent polysaccharide deacetylase family protein [Nitrospinota bacterium]|nr:divergent polysaccharide deacetylase family protein [Nitrospinota bacterium]